MAASHQTNTSPKAAHVDEAHAEKLPYAIIAWLNETPKQEPWSAYSHPLPRIASQSGQSTQLQLLEHDMKLDLDRLKNCKGFKYREHNGAK